VLPKPKPEPENEEEIKKPENEEKEEKSERQSLGGDILRTRAKPPQRRPPSMIGSQSFKGQEALLLWCQQRTADVPGVQIENFSTSWSDGLGFWFLFLSFFLFPFLFL